MSSSEREMRQERLLLGREKMTVQKTTEISNRRMWEVPKNIDFVPGSRRKEKRGLSVFVFRLGKAEKCSQGGESEVGGTCPSQACTLVSESSPEKLFQLLEEHRLGDRN